MEQRVNLRINEIYFLTPKTSLLEKALDIPTNIATAKTSEH